MTSKICIKCNNDKSLELFSKNKNNLDGFLNSCKTCCNEYARLRRISNPEYMVKWRKENVEKVQASRKTWNEAHPEKVEEYKIQCAQFYKDNPDKKKSKDKKYRDKNKLRLNAMNRKWRKNNPEVVRKHNLKKYFGLTVQDYDNMYIEQGGCCAICGTHQSELKLRLSVDHDHETGQLRGLLCGSCNTALGLLKDSIGILDNAISYLEQSIIADGIANG